jgi:hypothetical protein
MHRPFSCLILFCTFCLVVQAQKIANYGVEGWATYTIGGRGGTIIRVTNLNASGSGSFDEAISASGPRIVVFEVGGIINFQGKSKAIKHPFITIAGQTAPGKGITIINGGLSIQTHDVILQHIRIRPGASGHEVGYWEPDAMTTASAYNVIIDHCSFSWAVDENCSASGPRFVGVTPDDWRDNTSHTVTISHNIIAEGLSTATHTKGEHSKGTLIHDNVTEIAILNNLYASNKDRNPLFKGGARGVIVNNFIYNPGSSGISYGMVESELEGHEPETGYLSIVGNYLKFGPSTGSIVLCKVGNGPCKVYLADNIAKNRTNRNVVQYSGDTAKRVSVRPAWHDNIQVIPTLEVQENIRKNAGARPWDRDEIDARIVNEMLTGTGNIINYETEVGGYPAYGMANCPFIEDEWNLDYMMKLCSDASISSPEKGSQFLTNSAITVESVVLPANDSIRQLELIVNGVSAGKQLSPPYKWDLRFDTPGNYELLVIAGADSTMKLTTETISISLIDSSATDIKGATSAEPLSVSVFPNPISESTTITYQLVQPGFVTLTILNSMGQSVETLVSGHQHEGRQEVVWTAEALPPGLYFYRLMTGKEKFCNKLMLQ